MIVYHATSPENVEKIRREGLKIGPAFDRIYCTDRAGADVIGKHWLFGDYKVLRVTVPNGWFAKTPYQIDVAGHPAIQYWTMRKITPDMIELDEAKLSEYPNNLEGEGLQGRAATVAVEQAVMKFAAAHSQYASARGSFNQCSFASYDLRNAIDDAGVEAWVYEGKGWKGSADRAHPVWQKKDRRLWTHYVVKVGTNVIDLTARQFDASAPYPWIYPFSKFQSLWASVSDYRLGPMVGESAANLVDRLLDEGISPILFRRESISYALQTIEANRFTLTTVERFHGLKTSELKKLYFLSCSRTKSGGYMIRPSSGSVTYVLDGVKFGERYAGSPMDYWGPEMRNPQHNPDSYMRLRNDESEDRVYSDQPYIPNAASYIHEVHAFFSLEGILPYAKLVADTKWAWMFRKLYIACARQGLPLYLYTDASAFIALNKGRAVPPKQIDLLMKAPGPDEEERAFKRRMSTYGSVEQQDKKYLDALLFLWHAPVKKDGDHLVFAGNPENAKTVWDTYRSLGYSWNRKNDLRSSIGVILANNRKRPELVDSFLQTMRKGGFSDLDAFLLAVARRYYPDAE